MMQWQVLARERGASDVEWFFFQDIEEFDEDAAAIFSGLECEGFDARGYFFHATHGIVSVPRFFGLFKERRAGWIIDALSPEPQLDAAFAAARGQARWWMELLSAHPDERDRLCEPAWIEQAALPELLEYVGDLQLRARNT